MTDDDWCKSLSSGIYSATVSAASPASRESVRCLVAAAESAQAKRGGGGGQSKKSFVPPDKNGNKKQVTIMEPREEDLPSSRRQRQLQAANSDRSKAENMDSEQEEGDEDERKKTDEYFCSGIDQQNQILSASEFYQPPPPPTTTTHLLHLVADKLQLISPTNSNTSPVHSIDRQSSDNDSGCPLEEYAWVPAGLRPDLVHRYFSGFSESQIPYVNSAGEKLRVRSLLHQLPPHDNDLRYCHHLLDEQQRGEMRRFIAQRKQLALGRATVKLIPRSLAARAPCKQCRGVFKPGALAVFAARDGPYSCWHPQCFCCAQCNELLVDLIYFHNGDQKIYCGRHHAELWKPRCAACDEIIFSDDCTEAEGNTWHPQHFCCSQCDVVLGGRRYICRESRPYCVGCYEMLFSRTCSACKLVISVEQLQVSHNNVHWHAHEKCFQCQQCSTSLIDRHFLPRNGKVFCSTKCLETFVVVVDNAASVAGETLLESNCGKTCTGFVGECAVATDEVPPSLPGASTVVRQLEAIQEEDDEIAAENLQKSARRSAEEGSGDAEETRDATQLVASTSRVIPGSASVRRSASQRYVESFQLSSTTASPPSPQPPTASVVEKGQSCTLLKEQTKSEPTVTREDASGSEQELQNSSKQTDDRLIEDLASIYVNIFPSGLQTKIMPPGMQSSCYTSCTTSDSRCSSKESTPHSQAESGASGNSNSRASSLSSRQRSQKCDELRPRTATPSLSRATGVPKHDNGSCAHSCSVHSPCRRRPRPASNNNPNENNDSSHPTRSSVRCGRRPQRPVAISLENKEFTNITENYMPSLPNSLSSYSNFDPQHTQQQHRTPPPPVPVRHPQTILTPTADRRAMLLHSMSHSNPSVVVSPYSIGNATPNIGAKFLHHPAAPYYTPAALTPRCPQQQTLSDVGIEGYSNRRQAQQNPCHFGSSSSSAVSAHRYQPQQQPSTSNNKFMFGTVGGAGSAVRINTLTSANNSWLAAAATAAAAQSNAPWESSPSKYPPLGMIADDGIYSVGCLGHMSAAASRRRKKNCKGLTAVEARGFTSNSNNNSAMSRLASKRRDDHSSKADSRCTIS